MSILFSRLFIFRQWWPQVLALKRAPYVAMSVYQRVWLILLVGFKQTSGRFHLWYSSKCFSRHFICKFWIRQSEPKYFVLLVAGVDDRQSCTVRWGWQMRLVWAEWGQSHPGSVDTRGIKYQDITTKMALATQRVMLNEKYETGSHFPFSSNISESVSWLARSEQCFPSFIFSVKNRERRGCLAAEGDRRDEPSQSAQYKLAKSTQTLTLHPLLSSLETHGKRPYSVEGRKGNWTLDIVLLMWK